MTFKNFEDNLPMFPENTIPIRKWTGEKTDRELQDLIPLLECLAKVKDVTEIIKSTLSQMNKDTSLEANKISNMIGEDGSKSAFFAGITMSAEARDKFMSFDGAKPQGNKILKKWQKGV